MPPSPSLIIHTYSHILPYAYTPAGLQIIVRALILSMHGLADVALLIMFLFAIYAIVGIQLFEGVLHQYCYYPGGGEDIIPLSASTRVFVSACSILYAHGIDTACCIYSK